MIKHSLKVASNFPIYTKYFWLAVFHDTVEDGYLPNILCRYWSGLNAITRKKEETYFQYIERVKLHKTATIVKIADLKTNLQACTDSLRKRYLKALNILENEK